MQAAAFEDAVEARAPRVRVRTPGKHIVLFIIAAALMLSLSTSFLTTERAAPAPRGPSSFVRGDIVYQPFDPLLVDLSPDAGGRVAYLKLTPVVAATDKLAIEALALHGDLVRERMTFLLRALSPEDLDEDADLQRLKAELLERVNFVIAPARAEEVIVNELVIQ